jgi:hypothetical protein
MAEKLLEMNETRGYRPRRASSKSVAKWENDKDMPTRLLEAVNMWSEITGVDEAWLLKGDEWSKKRGNSTRNNRTGPGRNSRSRRTSGQTGTPLAA